MTDSRTASCRAVPSWRAGAAVQGERRKDGQASASPSRIGPAGLARKVLFKVGSRFILHPWFRLTRGMSLGVRALVRDENGRILLIRHSYAPGWLLPGGGVERGET